MQALVLTNVALFVVEHHRLDIIDDLAAALREVEQLSSFIARAGVEISEAETIIARFEDRWQAAEDGDGRMQDGILHATELLLSYIDLADPLETSTVLARAVEDLQRTSWLIPPFPTSFICLPDVLPSHVPPLAEVSLPMGLVAARAACRDLCIQIDILVAPLLPLEVTLNQAGFLRSRRLAQAETSQKGLAQAQSRAQHLSSEGNWNAITRRKRISVQVIRGALNALARHQRSPDGEPTYFDEAVQQLRALVSSHEVSGPSIAHIRTWLPPRAAEHLTTRIPPFAFRTGLVDLQDPSPAEL